MHPLKTLDASLRTNDPLSVAPAQARAFETDEQDTSDTRMTPRRPCARFHDISSKHRDSACRLGRFVLVCTLEMTGPAGSKRISNTSSKLENHNDHFLLEHVQFRHSLVPSVSEARTCDRAQSRRSRVMPATYWQGIQQVSRLLAAKQTKRFKLI